MSWVRDLTEGLQRVILIEARLTELADKYDQLAKAYNDINQRLARLEGKFELLERMGGRRRLRE